MIVIDLSDWIANEQIDLNKVWESVNTLKNLLVTFDQVNQQSYQWGLWLDQVTLTLEPLEQQIEVLKKDISFVKVVAEGGFKERLSSFIEGV